MEKLIVKNFGAIRNIEIDLKDLTIFIGKTGTGKSTLAKLVSIFRSANFWMSDMDNAVFSENLVYYQINNFLESSTSMEYQSEVGIFVYSEGKVARKFSESIVRDLAKSTSSKDFAKNFSNENTFNLEQEDATGSLEKLVDGVCNEVIYIPAERGVVSFLSRQYGKELTNVIPDTLLDFITHFNKVSSIIRQLYIGLFDVTYQQENDRDYIILSNDKRFLLSESASGLQAVIPAILIFEHYAQDESKKSYTFEEPELNLFPIAQKSLVELLAEKVLSNGHKVVITTHSPYILTAFNTLIQAGNVCKNNPHQKDAVSKIVPEKNWLNFDEVSVFYLDDSNVQNVMNLEYQTIDANAIDDVSDMIASEYDQLLELKYEQEE